MNEVWPALPMVEWKDTYDTLHMWTQIVGKIRLTKASLINHWWNSTLYVTSRGLTTSVIPSEDKSFEIDFDFIDHQLIIQASDGIKKGFSLSPRSVAEFYRDLLETLSGIGIQVAIHAKPDEVENPIPFAEDETHRSYNPEYANRFWRILMQVDRIFKEFRSEFIGKCSPVHFFWGSFDLAVTRFSGRRAPERTGADAVTREAYSHEVSSAGFWPGGGEFSGPAFYSYTVPTPEGFGDQSVQPKSAFYSKEMSEFFLLYDDIRLDSPEKNILEFLHSTYEAGANLANWDRANLERR